MPKNPIDVLILNPRDLAASQFDVIGSRSVLSASVVECQTCDREVASSNLTLGYFASRSTQPSIPSGLINEYLLQLGRQRQVYLIPLADETQGNTVINLDNACYI